jgi:hypothetical protein
MKLILFFPLIVLSAFGPIRRTGEMVEDFKTQTVVPASPRSGKISLYNNQGEFSQVDSVGNNKRIYQPQENLVRNFDVEQGLAGYVFDSPGITTGNIQLNIVTPLYGLKSITFTPDQTGDALETIPFTITSGMYGQKCMGQFVVGPTDGKLTASIVDGDNDVLIDSVIASSTIPQTIPLVFDCPLLTATANDKNLKIRIFQTSTVANPADFDSFYLGRFLINQIFVSDHPQWYYYTANADINGDFPFPAPTASTNDKTLFTYGAGVLTALKQSKIDFNISALGGFSNNTGGQVVITCTIGGVSRILLNTNQTVNASANAVPIIEGAISVVLNNGDICAFTITRQGIPISNQYINITATPLPSLASLIKSPDLPAGFYGAKTWAATAGCTWTKGAGMGDFPAIAACGPAVTQQGLAIADAASNGQQPQIRFNKMLKGIYTFTLTGDFNSTSAGGGVYQISNGTYSSLSTGRNANSANTIDVPSIVLKVIIPVDLGDTTFKVQANAQAGSVSINAANNASSFSIAASYEPDLSSPYSQSMIAALDPQVINSSGKSYKYETCTILNPAGTATLGSPDCNNWISNVSRTSLGRVTANLLPNIFSLDPTCVGSTHISWTFGMDSRPTKTQILMGVQNSSQAPGDGIIYLSCGGFQ